MRISPACPAPPRRRENENPPALVRDEQRRAFTGSTIIHPFRRTLGSEFWHHNDSSPDRPPVEATSYVVSSAAGRSNGKSPREIDLMAILRTTKLTFRYGHHRALSELDLEIPAGVSGLLGPNGAGKTTLLKIVLGFLDATQGDVEVLDVPARGRRHLLRERIGYFPERSVLVPGLSSVETVALAGEVGGLRKNDALARAHDMLWFTGLGDARYRPVEEFSMGMQQRTKLAMSLVHDPDLVLLDEPTSGLDPGGRRQMLDLIRDIGKAGVSVILSTHLLHDVEQVCENVVVLDRGKLVLGSKLDSLGRHPGRVYEVRVREDTPGDFRKALSKHELTIEEDSHGLLRITLAPNEQKADTSTRFLFEAAHSVGAEIRHLRRFETKLEETFLTAVDTGPHDGF